MRKIRKISLLTVLCLCLCLFAGCSGNSGSAVLTANGKAVERDEYLYYLRACKDSIESGFSEEDAASFWEGDNAPFYLEYVKSMAANQALTRIAIEQLCEEEGVSISDEDRATLKANKESEIEKLGGMAAYESALLSVNMNDRLYDLMAETSCLFSLLDAHYYGENGTRAMSDEDFTEYFKQNYYTANHILKSTVDTASGSYTPLDEETITQKKAEIDDLLAQAKGGADFAALAQENSDDPGIEYNPDGYTFTEGDMLSAFFDTASALKEGEISEVVETEVGYHIIKRMPLDLSYCTDNLESLRAAYYDNDFNSLITAKVEELSVEYADAYEAIDISALS